MNEHAPKAPPDPDRLEHFAANVAHDFNNLLTGILGNLELMQNRARRGGVTHFDGYLDGARNAGLRAAIFAQRLLAFSGRATQEFTQVSVAKLLRDIAEPMREQGTALTIEPMKDAIIFCDQAQAELALLELLSNAGDATANGGTIALVAHTADGLVSITVRDTGTGMEADVLNRATEPFFTTRPNGAGKGLGLPIVARFARQSGGTLKITSRPDQGTSVTLRLPVSAPK